MPVLNRIAEFHEEIAGWRRDFHAHPELLYDVQRTAADLTKSGAVLGYAPQTPFPEGIRRFVAWFREAYGRSD